MALPLDVAFAALIAVPAVIALASGSKDPTTRGIVAALAAIGGLWILAAYEGHLRGFLRDWRLPLVLALVAAGLGIAAAVRLGNKVLAALILVGAVGLGAAALDLLGGWAVL